MVSIDGGAWCFSLIQLSLNGTVGSVQTSNQSFDFNGESDLDLQYAMALVDPQPITLYQVGDIPEGAPLLPFFLFATDHRAGASFNNLLDALDGAYCTSGGGDDPTQDGIYPDTAPGGFDQAEDCGTAKRANVISTSYGANEADVTPAYAVRQCNEYGKLGLMGVTVLYSSGDNGVAGNGGVCLGADGSQSADGTRFNPTFPAGCPFVTAVGATQVNPNSTVFEPEAACEQVIFSGGGFSDVFARPSYQNKAVEAFLKNHPPPYSSAVYNTSKSRAYPDLSANGANYVVAVDGSKLSIFRDRKNVHLL